MSSETVVLKVKMSCQGCAGAVNRVLEKMEGVESFDIDLKEQKVTVKGNVKPQEVYETVSKSGKKTEFWVDLENKFTETATEPEPENKSTKIATKAELENKFKETVTEAENENKFTEIAQPSEAEVIPSIELDNKLSENSTFVSVEPGNKSSKIDNVVV